MGKDSTTDPLHTRLMGYLAKLRGREDPVAVIRDVGLTMAKDIDKHELRLADVEKRIRQLHGEPDA